MWTTPIPAILPNCSEEKPAFLPAITVRSGDWYHPITIFKEWSLFGCELGAFLLLQGEKAWTWVIVPIIGLILVVFKPHFLSPDPGLDPVPGGSPHDSIVSYCLALLRS